MVEASTCSDRLSQAATLTPRASGPIALSDFVWVAGDVLGPEHPAANAAADSSNTTTAAGRGRGRLRSAS